MSDRLGLMSGMATETVVFTVLAFSVVTHLYRRSMYPSFERARPGMYQPFETCYYRTEDVFRNCVRPQHPILGIRRPCDGRYYHHRHIRKQGPPLGCRQAGLSPYRGLIRSVHRFTTYIMTTIQSSFFSLRLVSSRPA